MAEDGYHKLAKLSVTKRAGELTERVWRNAQTQLVEFMEHAKAERIRSTRINVLQVRFALLIDLWYEYREEHPLGNLPPVRTFALIPEVREIIEAPNEVKDAAELFKALIPSIPDLIDRWRKTTMSQIEHHVQETLQLPETPSTSPLAITSFYHCRHCLKVISGLRVLSHSCSSHTPDNAASMDPFDIICQGLTVFDTKGFFVDVELVKPIIIACGQDPLLATTDAMDCLDIKLTCLGNCCKKYYGVRSVMSWRTAVMHSLQVSPSDGQWVKAAAYEKELVAQLEQRAAGNLIAKCGWLCLRCSYPQPSYGGRHCEVLEHLRTRYCGFPRPGTCFSYRYPSQP